MNRWKVADGHRRNLAADGVRLNSAKGHAKRSLTIRWPTPGSRHYRNGDGTQRGTQTREAGHGPAGTEEGAMARHFDVYQINEARLEPRLQPALGTLRTNPSHSRLEVRAVEFAVGLLARADLFEHVASVEIASVLVRDEAAIGKLLDRLNDLPDSDYQAWVAWRSETMTRPAPGDLVVDCATGRAYLIRPKGTLEIDVKLLGTATAASYKPDPLLEQRDDPASSAGDMGQADLTW